MYVESGHFRAAAPSARFPKGGSVNQSYEEIFTRRNLLKGAGAIAASTVFAGKTAQAAEQTAPPAANPDITGILASYMSKAKDRALPAMVEEKAKEHILDTIAAMVSGTHLPPGALGEKFAKFYGGEPISTVVGTNMAIGPIEAALANGVRAQSDETDDSNAPSHSHPGCSTVPAALALGEQFGISGPHFIRAVALGYDVGTRVTITLGGLNYQMRTHRDCHSMVSTFAACAAAASAASLSTQQMRWVLDYAAQQDSGIAAWERDTHHVEKALTFGGFPARNGVSTALLIYHGGSGVNNIFFGPNNFFDAFNPQADPEGLIHKLGVFYEIANTNIKKWSVGSPVQAPLNALEYIMKKHPFKLADVKRVIVTEATDEAMTVNNREMPDICLQYLVALMLVKGTVSFHDSHDRALMSDPAIVAARAKVDLVGSAAMQKLYPQLVANVEVVLNDGTTYSHRVNAVLGTTANPMTHEQIADKARDLMTPFLGSAQTEHLIDAIYHLENVSDIRTLRPLLQTT